MLAKVWKKALLAICIIACLFNVMHKLVSRTSLEVQLRSVQNQTSLQNDSQEDNDSSSESKTRVNINQSSNEKIEDEDTIVVIN